MTSLAQSTLPIRSMEQGFTLIELSIVLVIIGLIVGGVLMGQDLIKGASIRAAISQLQATQSASNGFRDKMQALAGDIDSNRAAAFGLEARSGAAGHGDANGHIKGGKSGANRPLGETLLYWNDLATAGMLKGAFQGPDTAVAVLGEDIPKFLPSFDLRKANLIVYAAQGENVCQLTKVSNIGSLFFYSMGNAISPAEAFAIDGKMDDGNGTTGDIIALGGGAMVNDSSAAVTTGPGLCLITGTLLYQSTLTTPVCQLRIRMY